VANWVFTCKSCGRAILHAPIPDTIWNLYFPAKPDLPTEGTTKVCSHCLVSFTYTRNELIYEKGHTMPPKKHG
jgi:hypothetical protein